jgi:hypothetical protein
MLAIFSNFSVELWDLIKHIVSFLGSNCLIITTFFLIYVTTVIYYYDRIKKYVDSRQVNQNNSEKFDERNDFVKKILLSYHEEQINIIKDIFSNPNITNYLNNPNMSPTNISENSDNTSENTSENTSDNTSENSDNSDNSDNTSENSDNLEQVDLTINNEIVENTENQQIQEEIKEVVKDLRAEIKN